MTKRASVTHQVLEKLDEAAAVRRGKSSEPRCREQRPQPRAEGISWQSIVREGSEKKFAFYETDHELLVALFEVGARHRRGPTPGTAWVQARNQNMYYAPRIRVMRYGDRGWQPKFVRRTTRRLTTPRALSASIPSLSVVFVQVNAQIKDISTPLNLASGNCEVLRPTTQSINPALQGTSHHKQWDVGFNLAVEARDREGLKRHCLHSRCTCGYPMLQVWGAG